MVKIEHIVGALDRFDNWTDCNEDKIRRLLGVDQKKAGVYLNGRQVRSLTGFIRATHTAFFVAR